MPESSQSVLRLPSGMTEKRPPQRCFQRGSSVPFVTNGNGRQERSGCTSSPAASERVINTTPHATNQQPRTVRCLFVILESPGQCPDGAESSIVRGHAAS